MTKEKFEKYEKACKKVCKKCEICYEHDDNMEDADICFTCPVHLQYDREYFKMKRQMESK